MNKLSSTSSKLLGLLYDGKPHSGTQLAQALSISRTAIWKHIQQLKEHGYIIESLSAKGYCLQTPSFVLVDSLIKSELERLLTDTDVDLHIFSSLNSTNDYLKKISLQENLIPVCMAEQQTQGRGRFNRTWYSPFGENIYLSIKSLLKNSLAEMSGFSLCVSLAIIDALTECGLEPGSLSIKWPNDILINKQKLAGVLIELNGEIGAYCEAIIGIGINVNMTKADIQQNWTSILNFLGRPLDRNKLAAHLITAVIKMIKNFEKYGFEYFKSSWAQHDVLFGQNVELNFRGQKVVGKCHGIDNKGNILLENFDGTLKTYSAGDASFHKE